MVDALTNLKIVAYYKNSVQFVVENVVNMDAVLTWIDKRLQQHSANGWKFKII